jgi:hypothetical protein
MLLQYMAAGPHVRQDEWPIKVEHSEVLVWQSLEATDISLMTITFYNETGQQMLIITVIFKHHI